MALRDLVFVLIMLAGMFTGLRKPVYAAAFFMWIGLAMPHTFTYGFAKDLPWANMAAIILLFSTVRVGFDKMAKTLMGMWPLLLLLMWCQLTTVTAFAPEWAVERMVYSAKILAGAFLIACTIRTRRDIVLLAAVFALSIGFYGLKGGIWVLTTGATGGSVRGPTQSAIEDNNDIAVALVTVLPLLYWLFTIATKRIYKGLILAALVFSPVAILGTYSRGGFVSLGVCVFLIFLRSKSKFKISLFLVPVLAASLAFMPQKFWDRMSTIQTYEQDDSANGRLLAWQTAFNIANANVTGGGFDYYKNPSQMLKFAPPGTIPRNVHSIFFGTLGEQGYIGLLLFLAAIALAFARIELSRPKRDPDGNIPEESQELVVFRRMLTVSLMSFFAGAAFVNVFHWEGLYYLLSFAYFGLKAYQSGEPFAASKNSRRTKASFAPLDRNWNIGRPVGRS